VVDLASPPDAVGESWGRGRRFGIVPLNDGRVYWFATANAAEHGRDPAGQLKLRLFNAFRGWHAPIEAIIAATPESAILRNDIYDRDPLSRWTHGHVTLLGDAAHPMTPNLGQGACQAMEDAVVLAACLSGTRDVDAALRHYEARRIPRTSRIVLASRRIGDMAQWENPLACALRNLLVRATPTAIAERQMRSVVEHELLNDAERARLAGSR
jgi:2-polyprenyl-6-methoxyphenol hydroxylase-like FAD-dependent oxidoreductase